MKWSSIDNYEYTMRVEPQAATQTLLRRNEILMSMQSVYSNIHAQQSMQMGSGGTLVAILQPVHIIAVRLADEHMLWHSTHSGIAERSATSFQHPYDCWLLMHTTGN